ncbi:MAG: carboxylesterase family protein [Balneolaceae bacterium]|nr:carboxylesterase family protein [Balneolaceae bacterium]
MYAWRPADFKVSAIFQGFAANFIKNGNPNGLGLPEWNPLSAGETSPNVMQIDVNARLKTGQNQQRYELLDSLQYPKF